MRPRRLKTINAVPYIDVMLVFWLIFMVAALMIDHRQHRPAASARTSRVPPPLGGRHQGRSHPHPHRPLPARASKPPTRSELKAAIWLPPRKESIKRCSSRGQRT